MAEDPKQSESFLRKVARFVANPTTDWKEINSRQDDPESELAKAELKAMIERKRRNDFVRKREFDMLRRLRREGLTPEQLAAAGAQNSSVISDADRPAGEAMRDDVAVKDKIDQIEQQMVKEGFRPSVVPRAAPAGALPNLENTTQAAHFAPTQPALPPSAPAAAVMHAGVSPPSEGPPSMLPTLPPLEMNVSFDAVTDVTPEPPTFDLVLSPTEAPSEEQELAHDPELDEAVIAFANGDNEACERALTELTQAGGPRNLHADTWLVRFDFYRATGQHAQFESLALEYVHLFGLSAPQWFSLPKLVAEGRRLERPAPAAPVGPQITGVTWTCPELLDLEGLALLKKRVETAPLPWVLDWSALTRLEAEAREPLTDLMRQWAKQSTEMRWQGGEQLLDQLRELTPVGERDTDTGWWMLRLEVLRVLNRPDQFDEAAIDYCVTYEVSPPSWDAARCKVRMSHGAMSTHGPSTNMPPSGTLGFLDSGLVEEAGGSDQAQVELSGQLIGDITEVLRKINSQVGSAVQVRVACPKLIRLDFIAAGDLLNWVLAQRSEHRAVQFVDAHRLVAHFFGAMGINEHARIKVRVV
ncbi:hypothetical protein HNQ51_000475 [Inhella inkyongensis]|uniref:STAS domain-containing protein n=1 Tax=Inhella inkyongensis TaxID=392593 RepID=A0A840S0Y9_9BURK|nr:STAS domain-containing protein [Inhella inkyongensis]MBB5203182.1 hypothetical protein [Inhella inkyongensis]